MRDRPLARLVAVALAAGLCALPATAQIKKPAPGKPGTYGGVPGNGGLQLGEAPQGTLQARGGRACAPGDSEISRPAPTAYTPGDCSGPDGAAAGGVAASGASSGAALPGAASAGWTVRGGSSRGASTRGAVVSCGRSGPDALEARPTGWTAWWARNRDAILFADDLPETGVVSSAGGLLSGRGRRAPTPSPTLSRGAIYTRVVPTLLGVLAAEDDPVLLGEAALALGRSVEPDYAAVAHDALRPLLAHADRELAATAALALGLTGSRDVTGDLLALLTCSREGHRLVGDGEVPRLVRTAAALGLGFVGDPGAVPALCDFVRGTSDAMRQTKSAALAALGLMPDAARDEAGAFLREALLDRRLDPDIQAAVPTALARLLGRDATPDLLAALGDEDTDRLVRRAAVLALGISADATSSEAITRLARTAAREKDAECRQYALVSLAKIGARDAQAAAHADAHAAIRDALVARLRDPRSQADRPWAALAAGLYGRSQAAARGAFAERVADGYRATGDPSQRGAFALALGLLGERSAGRDLRKDLLDTSDETLAGQLALALGLLGYREADGDVRALAAREGASAALRRDAGLALRLMDDPSAARALVESYADSGSLDRRAGLAGALAMLGRSDVLDPLGLVASDDALDPASRSSACAALGRLAEKTRVPWNAMLIADSPATESPGEMDALLASAF